jgi:hypothetical protein
MVYVLQALKLLRMTQVEFKILFKKNISLIFFFNEQFKINIYKNENKILKRIIAAKMFR